MNIVVVGVGAIGSHLILFSRNIDANFTVIDFDKIETKNTLSQFHTRMSVRKNKAKALSQTMSALYGKNIAAISNKLTDDNVDVLLGKADLVVDCLDNGDSRRVIQGYVRSRGIACLHGGLAPEGQFGRVIWDDHFVIDNESGENQPTCEDGEHLPFIVRVSSCMAESIKQYVKNNKRFNYQITPSGVIRI